jgi:hypothetical protein
MAYPVIFNKKTLQIPKYYTALLFKMACKNSCSAIDQTKSMMENTVNINLKMFHNIGRQRM